MKTLVCLVAIAVVAFVHSPARACGGLFCSTTPAAPAPVDQTAERIVFEVDEETITAHIQISYVGEAEEFAWIVPVAAEPEVTESTDAFFANLDQFSQLQVQLPPSEPCAQPTGDGGGGGCGCSSDEASAGGGDLSGVPRGNVDVLQHDYTDNYEFVVLAAEETEELVGWLQDNAFNISDNMTPVIDVYNSPGMLFLAVKLREGRAATDIVPISMTYAGDLPSIPIRLTAVAAQPLMGILVFILGDRPYAPANYQRIVPDAAEILFDANGNTNYFEWVARATDEADGQLWVAEYVDTYPVTSGYLSRYYTRMSPHHMTLDPVFQPVDPSVLQVTNTLDLTAHQTVLSCGSPIQERLPSACAFNYCGRDALCAENSSGAAVCDCAAGDVAQSITGPDGQRHITCVPAQSPYSVTPETVGAGGVLDPCNAMACGDGICMLRGGFPTCQCNENAFASLSSGSVSCAPVVNPTTYGPGAGSESEATWTPAPPPADATRMAGWTGVGLPILLLLMGLAVLRNGARPVQGRPIR